MAYSVHIGNLRWLDLRGIVQMVTLHDGDVVVRNVDNGIADIVCEFDELALAGTFFQDLQELIAIAKAPPIENFAAPRAKSNLATLYSEVVALFETDLAPKAVLSA